MYQNVPFSVYSYRFLIGDWMFMIHGFLFFTAYCTK